MPCKWKEQSQIMKYIYVIKERTYDFREFFSLDQEQRILMLFGMEHCRYLWIQKYKKRELKNYFLSSLSKRRRPDLNRWIRVLQTHALPLGYCAIAYIMIILNDSKGIWTPVTAVKGRCLNHLTMEPFPRNKTKYIILFLPLQVFFRKFFMFFWPPSWPLFWTFLGRLSRLTWY